MPNFHTYVTKNLPSIAFDVKWIPSSSKLTLIGQSIDGMGTIQIYNVDANGLSLLDETEKYESFKCGTFASSSLRTRHFATGDFSGKMSLWDLERMEMPVYSVRAHEEIVNCIDGCGGNIAKNGPPEIATGSRDGDVKIWDTRQKASPVAVIHGAKQGVDVWAVAFGNSWGDQDRSVCIGYDNGDIKLVDLRSMEFVWGDHVNDGVCSLEFSDKTSQGSNIVATTVQSKFHVFHRTPESMDHSEYKAHESTIWSIRHLPQNPEYFVTSGGDGCIALHKYGSDGKVAALGTSKVSSQPVCAVDWNHDKPGLCASVAFDQTITVSLVDGLE
ncbi:WD repeat-containing protein 92 [Basidiobolus meristosporus CBS 931.73]|uniref:WD repeat-containing protein 92 n=1 Tax=Basidiobolus meristosporus CBS 931.73 TaxID=1314790 RepID=A0A1Y1XT24_9FUNG|nr:WD repeat-containing protein 92 [Basidiobolus meristosporus CBS 931.73]|eukprot:ORX88888.1 WD repeat-containing protein 92 [Basidiobolus meristosporus CBS 931.73]